MTNLKSHGLLILFLLFTYNVMAQESKLVKAITRGNLSKTEKEINKGANLNELTASGKPPLMIATELGEEEIVKLLVNNGSDIDLKDKSGHTALLIAAYNGELKILKYLSDNGANILHVSNNNRNATELAILGLEDTFIKTRIYPAENNENIANFEEVAIYLLDNDIVPSHFETMKIVCKYCSSELVKKMIEKGAVTDNGSNNTLLHTVAEATLLTFAKADQLALNEPMANLVMEHSKRKIPTEQEIEDIENNYVEIIQILVNAGINPNMKNDKGKTAFDIASSLKIAEALKELME